MLTTGVDAPTCKNVVLVRVIGSMTEFKQIIGRGTRVRDDYGKLFFNILDYTGSATRLFADPDFDGEPVTDDRRGRSTTRARRSRAPSRRATEEEEPSGLEPTDEDGSEMKTLDDYDERATASETGGGVRYGDR